MTSQLLMKVNEEEETGEGGWKHQTALQGTAPGESSGGDSYSESEVETIFAGYIF